MYFSRLPIPYLRENTALPKTYYRHIGIYAYRCDVLRDLVRLPASVLENAEKLEQLRWIDYGYEIFVDICDYENISIDTPEDLARAEHFVNY